MSLENYTGTALDTEVLENFVQPEPEPTTEPTTGTEDNNVPQTESTAVEGEATPTENAIPQVESIATPTTYNIDGIGEVTAEDIKTWKQGNLRQSDYTKKTQELARMREESKEAIELVDYLKNNPHLIQGLMAIEKNVDARLLNTATNENSAIRDIAYRQRAMETDMKLNDLHTRYGEFDDVALLQKATDLRTDDLEFVLKAISFDGSQVDRKALIEEAKRELIEEIENNKKATSTIVSSRTSVPVTNTAPTLTAEQKAVAAGMGMTEKEYAKWMSM